MIGSERTNFIHTKHNAELLFVCGVHGSSIGKHIKCTIWTLKKVIVHSGIEPHSMLNACLILSSTGSHYAIHRVF